jgi:hypothetical protein
MENNIGDSALFSPWLHWDQRLTSSARDVAGVYLLGRFEEGAPSIVDPCDERVLLIAETHNQSLADRWYQFNRCAFKGADGHSGGRTFYRLFSNGPEFVVPGWLFISAHGVHDENDVGLRTKGLKNRLLAEYEERHGVLPRCNTNGPAGAEPQMVVTAGGITHDLCTSAPRIEPKIQFSDWMLWADRKKIKGGEFAGIYALARITSNRPNAGDVLNECVVYIGETCENSLLGRLSQFNRSAFLGKDGHSGGWTYRTHFNDAGEALYVSICPVEDLGEPHRSAFIRSAKRQVLWEYVKRWGRRPVCNNK